MRTNEARAAAGIPDRTAAQSGIILIGAVLLALAAARLYGYLLFHTAVELFTLAVAWSIFLLAWNARRLLESDYLLLVGIASLFVGVLDGLHALAYKGMGVFPGGSADLPTQFWIAARYLESVSFLVAPVWLRRRLNAPLALGAYGAITLALMALVLSGRFPVCFVEGAGLTRFKVASEYAVIAILLASLAFLFRRRAAFDRTVLAEMAAAIGLTVVAELAFTLYVDVYGAANVTGHLLRVVAVWYIYRAIVVTGLVRPYDLLFRNLARSEEALRAANEQLETTVAALRRSDERYRAFVANTSEGICRVETRRPVPVALPEEEQVREILEHGYVAECNDAFARMQGALRADDVIGARIASVLPRPEAQSIELLRSFIRSGYRLVETELSAPAPDGRLRWATASYTGVVEDGSLVRAWGVQHDVTGRKRAALERERLIADLQRALAEVKRLSGLLPICARCKKIRDDKGYWTRVESYLQERAEVSFTHGICPECAKVLYPDF